MPNNCKHCKKEYYPESDRHDHGFCTFHKCRKAQNEYYAENFHELPEGKYRTRFENDFYELTDIQKEKYSYFLSLIKPHSHQTKGRKCMRCKRSMGRQDGYQNHRICSACHIVIESHGILAQ